jgi:hypothetical protein
MIEELPGHPGQFFWPCLYAGSNLTAFASADRFRMKKLL